MFFDRYEIHIQAFVHFIDGKCIIFQSSSPQNYFKKYILKKYIDIKYFCGDEDWQMISFPLIKSTKAWI